MSDFPRVSVVIVTWNGLPLLQRFLPSVLASTYPNLEVVIADNASTDGTTGWLAAEHPEVIVVRHPGNWLFARGNNAAVPSATGDLVLFLNNDVEVPPGWLEPLVAAMTPDVAAVQPKLLQHADRTLFEYAGAAGGFLDRDGIPFTRGRLFSTLEHDRGQYDDARDVDWACGAALLVRRDAFLASGGFDERFGMHMEEIDLCWRLRREGWRIRAEPASEVYHLGGASLPQGDPRKAFLNYRNGLAMLAKNLPDDALRPILRRRRALDTTAALRAVASGNADEARSIRRAWGEFRSWLPTLPRPADGQAVVLPSYRGSVIVDHFARQRQHFSDLPTERFTRR